VYGGPIIPSVINVFKLWSIQITIRVNTNVKARVMLRCSR